MEEAQEILLNSLESSGISLPTGVSSIQDLTPDALVSICAQSLHLIDNSSLFPTSLPVSMADRFQICAEIASAVKNIGYRGDLSFHQFLYPSDEDLYKLVRFLVEKLSRASESREFASKKVTKTRFGGNEEIFDKVGGALKNWTKGCDNLEGQSYQTVPFKTCSLRIVNSEDGSGKKAAPLITHQEQPRSRIGPSILEYSDLRRSETEHSKSLDTVAEEVFVDGSLETCLSLMQTDELAFAEVFRSGTLKSSKEGLRTEEELSGELVNSERDESVGKETPVQGIDNYFRELEEKLVLLLEQSSKIRCEVKELRRQEKMLVEEVDTKASEVQLLDNEHALLKAAVEMAFDEQHPVGYYIEELNSQVEARRNNLMELESQWDAFKQPLVEEKISLEQSLHAHKSEVHEKLLQVEEVELEIKAIKSELLKRDEECSQLLSKLENQPKIASRKSYIQRITEITKNSRKQDTDIEWIKQETRDLQMESNSIQDRLHRTYAVVDEAQFRDAKKDPVRRQAYRLLTTLHESFIQISDGILATDRAQREAADQEAKLAATDSRSFDIDKLQADLAAIRRENDFLEKQVKRD